MGEPLHASSPITENSTSSDSELDSSIDSSDPVYTACGADIDTSYEGDKPYFNEKAGQHLYQQLLFKSNSWSLLPAIMVFVCQACKIFLDAPLRLKINKGCAKTRAIKAQWYKETTCPNPQCKAQLLTMYYILSRCVGGGCFTSSFKKVRDELNKLTSLPDGLKTSLERRFALMELINQWNSQSDDKKGYKIIEWTHVNSSSKGEVSHLLESPLPSFKVKASISNGALFCSKMKTLDATVSQILKNLPEGTFGLSKFLLETAGSSHAVFVLPAVTSISTASNAITSTVVSAPPVVSISTATVTATSVCMPPPLSQSEVVVVNGNSERRAAESELSRESRRMAINMQAMYNVRPECNIGKRKIDDAYKDLNQKIEKKQKIENRLHALLQEYRSTREELVSVNADVRQAFQKMTNLTEVDMSEYPSM